MFVLRKSRTCTEAKFSAVPFEPVDPAILSNAIPAFFIGRNNAGLWVVREVRGRIGGIFLFKNSALAFAHAQCGSAGCAAIFPSERFELDLENNGNPFADHLAPLARLASNLIHRIGKIVGALSRRTRNFHAF
jgi:hypothetical protein